MALSRPPYSGPIIYNGLPATMERVGDSYVKIKYESSSLEPDFVREAEIDIAKTSGILQYRQLGTQPVGRVKLTPQAKVAQHRINVYLKELRKLTDNNTKGVGGQKKRVQAIARGQKILGDERPPSPSTLGEWAKAENEKILGAAEYVLAPVKRVRKTKFCDEVMLLVHEAIDESLTGASSKHMTFKNVHRKLLTKVAKSGRKFVQIPGYGWLKKKIKKLIWEKLDLSGLKATEIKKLLRNAVFQFVTERPLQRTEADGLYMQIGVLDDEGNYLGPVTLIIILDVYTRAVLGYSMRVGKGESSSAIIHAIRHAVLDKKPGSFHTVKGNSWFAYGIFENFVTDGGSAFVSIQTHSYFHRIVGTFTEVVEVAAGWLKPFIERFNYTVRLRFAAKIPGYVGTMEDQKMLEHEIKKAATLTLNELRQKFESWVVDEYHHTPHSGLKGYTPAEMWQKALDEGWQPEVPADEDSVRLPSGNMGHWKVLGDDHHIGIHVMNAYYNDGAGRLKKIAKYLISEDKEPVVYCEYSDEDISVVSVLDPMTDEFFLATAKDQDIKPGMTRAEHSIQIKQKKERMNREAPNVLDEDEDLAAQREEHAKKTKGKQRRKRLNSAPEKLAQEIEKAKTTKPHSAVDDHKDLSDDIDFDSTGGFEVD